MLSVRKVARSTVEATPLFVIATQAGLVSALARRHRARLRLIHVAPGVCDEDGAFKPKRSMAGGVEHALSSRQMDEIHIRLAVLAGEDVHLGRRVQGPKLQEKALDVLDGSVRWQSTYVDSEVIRLGPEFDLDQGAAVKLPFAVKPVLDALLPA